MVSHRPFPSSECIEGKACLLVGSNYYYNDLLLLTSGAALRLVTSVKAALKVASWTAKMTCLPDAALLNQRGGLKLSKVPSLAGSGGNCLKIPLLLPWSWLVESEEWLEAAQKIGSRDQVGILSKKIFWNNLHIKWKTRPSAFEMRTKLQNRPV